MATREFHKVSDECAGVNAGIKFKTIKAHRKVQGTLNEGVEVVLDSIAHFSHPLSSQG